MTRVKPLFAALAATLMAAPLLAGQENFAGARSSGRLDASGASARDEALGNAVVAMGDGATGFLANPALLAGRGLSLSLDQSAALGFSRSLLAGTYPMADWGSVGARLGYADLGAVGGIDLNGKAFNIRPYQLNFGGAYGRALPWGLGLGLGLDFLTQSFGQFGSAQSFGGNLGLLWSKQGFSFGLVQALESDLGAQTVMSKLKVGATYRLNWLDRQSSQAGVQLDYDYALGRILRLGLEHGAFGVLALRGGYEVPMESAYALRQWTAGVGARLGAWTLDFSYGGRDLLGSSQHATLTWTP